MDEGARQALATIVVVPRERFSFAERSLASLLEHTAPPYELVYVDGRSPRRVRRALERAARVHGFRLMRSHRYLAPNEARTLGLAAVETRYAVFVENDVLVTPGWLDALVRCAEETGAWSVGPLSLEGEEPERRTVHQAGAFVEITHENGRAIMRERHRCLGARVADVSPFVRERCDLLEYHCMLVRTAEFRAAGVLDRAIVGTRDHVDACLTIRAAGGSVVFEPAAVIAFVPPPPLAWTDYPYFLLRWSEAWTNGTLEHFRRKWQADPQPEHFAFLRAQRRLALEGFAGTLGRILGTTIASRIMERVVVPLEVFLNRHLVPRLFDRAARPIAD